MLRGRRTTYLQPSIRVLLCNSPIPGEGTPHGPAGARVAAGARLARRGSRSATAVFGESEHGRACQVCVYACEERNLVGCEDKDRLGERSPLVRSRRQHVRHVMECPLCDVELTSIVWQIGGCPERMDGVSRRQLRKRYGACAWTVTCDATEASL